VFKVFDVEANEFRTVLDWKTREELESIFRAAGRAGQLLCPHCREQVIFRYSDIHMPHFAHKALGACPYSSESMAILQARAALYGFLKKHFGASVEIEHALPASDMPRPVDCWVQRDGKPIAYWLMEKGTRGTVRIDALHKGITGTGAIVHFVFLAQILRELPEEKGVFRLTPTEEHLMYRSKWDNAYSDYKYSAGSLHYLNVLEQSAELVTLRSLRYERCVRHFSSSNILRTEISKMAVDAESGEFVHPGEESLLLEYQREKSKARMERQRRAIPHRDAPILVERSETEALVFTKSIYASGELDRCEPVLREGKIGSQERAGPCERCGIVTSDWMSFDGKTGRCKCNNCFNPTRKQG